MNHLISKISSFWNDAPSRSLIAATAEKLDTRYDLSRKIAAEPGVAAIVEQMFERLAESYPELNDLQSQRILDIACGSNTSKAPESLNFRTLGGRSFPNTSKGYTAMFEPWFCRILLELGAFPVGVDMGDLEGELFEHYAADLGQLGSLDFLPSHSFDAVQDSRLFGSPEFTAQFPNPADRLQIAEEIARQEQRLLKPNGIVIHSDAVELVR